MPKLNRPSAGLTNDQVPRGYNVPIYDDVKGISVSQTARAEYGYTPEFSIDFKEHTGQKLYETAGGYQIDISLYDTVDSQRVDPTKYGYDGSMLYMDESATVPIVLGPNAENRERYTTNSGIFPDGFQGTILTWFVDFNENPSPASYRTIFSISDSQSELGVAFVNQVPYRSVVDFAVQDDKLWVYLGTVVRGIPIGTLMGSTGGFYDTNIQNPPVVEKNVPHLLVADTLSGKLYLNSTEIIISSGLSPYTLDSANRVGILTENRDNYWLGNGIGIYSITAFNGLSLNRQDIRNILKVGPQQANERLVL